MIVKRIGSGTPEDPYRYDVPENVIDYEYIWRTEKEAEIKITDKMWLLKEENKALKAELKLQRDRIAEAKDFKDFKTKIKKVKDSEEKPTKWKHKEEFLEGEKIEHKGVQYISLRDHKADKDKEPPNELYRKQP